MSMVVLGAAVGIINRNAGGYGRAVSRERMEEETRKKNEQTLEELRNSKVIDTQPFQFEDDISGS